MAKFSIIVPMYNAEQTICRCVKSILQQTYNDFELLLIDDGSSDCSYDICINYKKKDKRVKLFAQENGGASKARNLGLDKATGEWICFVDSDDYLSKSYLEELNASIIRNSKADMIFMGYYKVNSQTKDTLEMIPRCYGKTDVELILSLVNQEMYGFTWIKIFRRTNIINNRFREDMELFEDEIFVCEALLSCNNIEVLEKPLYYYVFDGNMSLMNRTYMDYCEKCDEVYKTWKRIFELKPEYKRVSFFINHQADYFVSRCIYYGMERNLAIKDYFLRLGKTSFFKEHLKPLKIDKYIKDKQFCRIWLIKKKYKLKIRISLYMRRMNLK